MVKKNFIKSFYKLDEAINFDCDSKSVFIIANERLSKNGKMGRYFSLFSSFKLFLENRNSYPHCHEIFVNHKNNKKNIAGRLVFDFDIKLEKIPDNFKDQIENTIKTVTQEYYNDVNYKLFVYVWSTSENSTKISKHLTVKNLYFDDWIMMSKKFYNYFSLVWDKNYDWIKSEKLVDSQIIRKRASLRMVESSKIGGKKLLFDDPEHLLTDSLIKIYFLSQRQSEQHVTKSNLNEINIDNIIDIPEINANYKFNFSLSKYNKYTETEYEETIYKKAFELQNEKMPNIFMMGKCEGKFVSLIRKNKSKCFISGKIHENENAFLIINLFDNKYYVRFGCYRFCSNHKTVPIGSFPHKNKICAIQN